MGFGRRLVAAAFVAALFTMATASFAQVTLPYAETFEAAGNTTYFGSTPSIAGVPNFRFQAGGTKTAVGPTSNAIGAEGSYTAYTDGLVFNVTQAVWVEGVHVYPTAAGTVSVRLLNSSNTVLRTATFPVTTTGKTFIPLGWNIAVGTGYRMDAVGTTTSGLSRNTAGAAYPYTAGGVSITGPINALAGYYYFFYDWRVVPSPGAGRLRTQVPWVNSGLRAATLDRSTCTTTAVQNYLVMSLNMTNYTTATPIELTFQVANHGSEANVGDRVWVRGNNSAAFIQVYNLNQLAVGSWTNVTINLSSVLSNASQNFGSTFEVWFGQEDDCDATDLSNYDGFTFDNITIAVAQICGNGVIEGTETCDDGNLASLDGCNASCAVEYGFYCSGQPSSCMSECGDGLIASDEDCDDSNMLSMDGCDSTCAVENGYTCGGEPSVCSSTCGDGIIAAGDRDCDDGNTDDGDGCTAGCTLEPGWSCGGQPSVCAEICGDGLIVGTEECDDDNSSPSDGCTSCNIDNGYDCSGEPSVCDTICGDGITAGDEECDDGNTTAGDGCDALCMIESTGVGGAGGGATGTGGSGASGGTSGGDEDDGASEDDGGCGCRVVGGQDGGPYGLAAIALLGLALAGRRRRES